MTKRAKLSLVEGKGQTEKKSTAFEDTVDQDTLDNADEDQPEQEHSDRAYTSSSSTGTDESSHAAFSDTAPESAIEDFEEVLPSSWLNRKTIIKAAVVVGAAAVAIYLIRRRFR